MKTRGRTLARLTEVPTNVSLSETLRTIAEKGHHLFLEEKGYHVCTMCGTKKHTTRFMDWGKKE